MHSLRKNAKYHFSNQYGNLEMIEIDLLRVISNAGNNTDAFLTKMQWKRGLASFHINVKAAGPGFYSKSSSMLWIRVSYLSLIWV